MQDNGKTKTTLCIEMLQYLSDGRVWKIADLAEKLQTNRRNISAYRQELEWYGEYEFAWVPGKQGGIRLIKDKIIPSIRLTDEEKEVLLVAGDYLKSRPGVFDYNLYQKAMSKIFASIKDVSQTEETLVVPVGTLTMSNEEFRKRYVALKECISKRMKISIEYLSIDNVRRTRIFSPYELFMYNNAWFVIGYCDLVKDIRYFKLNKIEKFMILYHEKKFIKPRSFDRKAYCDETGFKVGIDWMVDGDNAVSTDVKNDWVHLKLEFTGKPAVYVREYKHGENQVVTFDNDKTILECDMQYKYNALKFVLGFGTDCKVLEPEWLKVKVIETIKEVLKKY